MLLAGSDLEWRVINDATIVIKKRTTPATSPSPQMGVSAEAKHTGGVKEQNVQELDDVIVVGSRLGTSPVESAMPIKVINREQIDRSGAGNITQVLSYLSEVSVNKDRMSTRLNSSH